MSFHRLRASAGHDRNFLVALSIRQQLQHFTLSRCERMFSARLVMFQILPQEKLRNPAVKKEFVFVEAGNSVDQVAACNRFR